MGGVAGRRRVPRPGMPGTGAARDQWLLVLLRELGYGQVQVQSRPVIIDGHEYPISHRWNHVVMHLLGPGVDLDRHNPGVPGAARAPQAMVQEYLNRVPEHLWAILSNGLQLRLLRDSTALAGSAYLEFDLETIFDGELYPRVPVVLAADPILPAGEAGGADADRRTVGSSPGAARPSMQAPGRWTSSATGLKPR